MPRHRRHLAGCQVSGNTFLKVVSDMEQAEGYEEQVISVWLDMNNESGESYPSHTLLISASGYFGESD